MKQSLWSKPTSELTTLETMEFAFAMAAVSVAVCYGPFLIVYKWGDICEACGNLKDRIMGRIQNKDED